MNVCHTNFTCPLVIPMEKKLPERTITTEKA